MISTSPTTDPRITAGAQAILQACERYVPANANIDEAIVAHRLAFAESGRSLAAYAIRAVIFAATKTREQAQRQVDYLTSLPIEAWERLVSGGEPEAIREETLAGCARCLARMVDI